MGIPAFYRWLVERYPLSVVDAAEETPKFVNGIKVPIDTSTPNPNGVEFDNLYLDMNGIIHPCFHPEGLTAPETYAEVFKAVFKYLDRIFSIVRPRKLLYMALDGVAPRAKMNQQRARRFRAAKDAADEASNTGIVRGNDETEGGYTNKLDSNVITPGTKFMELLSSALRYYVQLKMNVDSGWQGIKVILSDASVPGEGEHKIMSYIRLQRNLPGFDPNTSHCLYGLDADLIMLALATHEVHFSILREDVRKYLPRDRGLSSNRPVTRSSNRQEAGRHSKKGEECANDLENLISAQKFQFLRVWILREYLGYELQIPDRTVKVDLERLIDDFVFMCLFVGNDFLPHVPSLEISEGAIDLLIYVYKKEFVNMGGYLTDSCQVNLERAGRFIQFVGSYENKIFTKRMQAKKDWEMRWQRPTVNLAVKENQDKINHVPAKTLSVVDKVKLGQEGWKERYYAEKFESPAVEDRVKIQKDAVLKYVEGICWVMHYYYQGVCSWQWFYPYHYAPFASDFHDLDQLEIHFTIGKPFKPFDQLMGVLPAASAQALPFSYRKLMSDPSSPILDFYPSEFELDLNGKRHPWQAVCKLPFIEEGRLLSEIANVEDTLTVEEKQRNSLGLDVLFVYVSHPLAEKIISFCAKNKDNPKLPKAKVRRKINPEFSHGMNGFIYISDKPVCPVEIYSPIEEMGLIADNKVICVFYKVPRFHPHIPRPPGGVIMPRRVIFRNALQPQPILWHNRTALAQNQYSRRQMPPHSVSGPKLARMAHQLVSKSCLPKQQVNGDGSNASLGGSKTQQVKGDVSNDNLGGSKKRKRNGDGSNDSIGGSKTQQVSGDAINDTLGGSRTQQVIGDGSNYNLGESKAQEVNGDISNGSVGESKRQKKKHKHAAKLRQLEDTHSESKQQQVNESNNNLGGIKTFLVNGDGSNDSLGGSKEQQLSADGIDDNPGGSKTQQVIGDGSNASLGESKTQEVNIDVSNGSVGESKSKKQRNRAAKLRRLEDTHSESKQQQVNESNDSLSGRKTFLVKAQQVSGDGINDNLGRSQTQQLIRDGSNDGLGQSKTQEVNGSIGESKRQKKQRNRAAKLRQLEDTHSESKQQQVNESKDSLDGCKTFLVNGDGSNDSLGGSKAQQVNGDGINDNLGGSKTQQVIGDGSNDGLGQSKTQEVNGSVRESKRQKKKRNRAAKLRQLEDTHRESKQQQVNESKDSLGGCKAFLVNGDGSNDSLGGSKAQQVNGDGITDNLGGSKTQQVIGDGSNDGLGQSKTQEVNGSVGESKRSKKKRNRAAKLRQLEDTHSESKQQQVNESKDSLGGSKTFLVNGDGSNDSLSRSKAQQVSGDGINDNLGGSKVQQVNGDVSNGSVSGSKRSKKRKKSIAAYIAGKLRELEDTRSESKQQQVNESNDSLGGSKTFLVNGDGNNDSLGESKGQQVSGDGINDNLGRSQTQQVNGEDTSHP